MLLSQDPKLQQLLKKIQSDVANGWYQAIAPAEQQSDLDVALFDEIAMLATEITDLICVEPLDTGQVQAVGKQLARLSGSKPEVLAKVQLLFSQVMLGSTTPAVSALLPQVLGNLALGFYHGYSPPANSGLMRADPVDPASHNMPPEELNRTIQSHVSELKEANRNLREKLVAQQQIQQLLRKRNQELTLFNRTAQIFYSSLDLDQVLSAVLDELSKLMGVLAYSVWLVNWETSEVVCWKATAVHSEVIIGWRLPIGEGIVGWVAKHGQSAIVPDVRTDHRHMKRIDQQLGIETRSMVSVPLWGSKQVIGVVQVLDTKVDRFSDSDGVLVEFVANAASIAVENALRFDQTRRDAESKSMLLREVNHRVKNNLSVVKSILSIKRNRITQDDSLGYRAITEDVMNHVQSLATVHNLLSASDWKPLPLDQLSRQVITAVLRVLLPNTPASVGVVSESQIYVSAEQAHDLALMINELVTNSAKYAGVEPPNVLSLTVTITASDDTVRFKFKDNGAGYSRQVMTLSPEYYNLGLELLQNIAHHNLDGGTITLYNDAGAVTVIEFKASSLAIKQPDA